MHLCHISSCLVCLEVMKKKRKEGKVKKYSPIRGGGGGIANSACELIINPLQRYLCLCVQFNVFVCGILAM